MLKKIYNFLLVTLLSGSLLMLDFGVKGAQLRVGFSQSYAQTESTTQPTTEKVKLDAAKDNDLMATLTMTSIGLLTQRLYKCKLTTDMMVAAAGGAAYIAGEIMATFKLKSVMKELEKEIKKTGTVTDANNQIEDFKKLRKSYEEAKGTANTKKMLQMAAAAAFAIAGGIAAYQYFTMKAAQRSCIDSLRTMATTCAVIPTIVCPSCKPAAGPLSAGSATKETAAATGDVPGPSATKEGVDTAQAVAVDANATTGGSMCPQASAAAALCKSSYVVEKFNKGVCLVPPVVYMDSIIKNPFFANKRIVNYTPMTKSFSFTEFFMPSAHADLFSPLGIISSAAISFALMTSATLGIQIDTFLFSPLNRGIIWGVLAGLTYMASSATDNQIKTIEQNIQKIDAIIAELEALRKGNQTGAGTDTKTNNTKPTPAVPGGKDFSIANNGNFQDVDMSKEGVKFPCINGEYTNHCDNFSSLMNEKMSNLKDLPPDLKSQIGNLSNMADGINGTSTLSTGTMASAAALAAQANALRSNLNSKQQKIQDMLNRDKNNKLDIAKRSNAIKNDMLKAVGKELEKRGTTPAKMLASFGGSGSLSSKFAATNSSGDGLGAGGGAGANGANGASGAEALDPNKLKNTTATVDVGAGASSELSEAAKAGSNDTNGIDPLAGQSAAGAAGKNGDGTKTASMDDYDLKNDINLNKDVDLFKVITNRYQKSAYPRLFKRVK
jgi:hypothetical protein